MVAGTPGGLRVLLPRGTGNCASLASGLTELRALFPSKLSRLTGKCGASKNYSERPAARPRMVQGVPFQALRSDLSYRVRFRGASEAKVRVASERFFRRRGSASERKPTPCNSLAPKAARHRPKIKMSLLKPWMRRAALTLVRHHVPVRAGDVKALNVCDYTHTDLYNANAHGNPGRSLRPLKSCPWQRVRGRDRPGFAAGFRHRFSLVRAHPSTQSGSRMRAVPRLSRPASLPANSS